MAKEKLSYNNAINEIEDILYDIENNDIEVDKLSEKVNRVSFLLEMCKKKLLDTEKQIEKIFDSENH